MALKKSELYSSLWSSCDELRGGMDASQYKDYVLVLLFVKYVSDKYADVPYAPITIPEGASFKDMVALKGKTDIGDQINKKIIAPLALANKLSDMPDFNDATKLGTGKDMVDRLTNLVSIFENKALDFSKNRADGDDILGDAYEYLMRHFATESGKSKGQFYTPAEVSRVMAQIIGIGKANTSSATTVYDPTCGSGSLLLKVADDASTKVTIYGQEKDAATAGLARMNMILHNNPEALIKQGNTLANPLFTTDDGQLKTFDFVVANPPFSDKRWSNGVNVEQDPHERFSTFGAPPAKQGDYAYLLHIVRSLKSGGQGACILPHGVLFRGNAEAEIRRKLIQRGYIKAIIGLPANLFYGTGIPACIIVLDKADAQARKGIFMIDASKGFVKDGNKNRLRDQDIHKIVDTFSRQLETPKYSRMVPVSEISDPKNDFNLNLPRYIDSTDAEDLQDIEGHLRGGIPNRDIDDLAKYWEVFPNVRKALFQPAAREGYSQLRVPAADIKATIFGHPEFMSFNASVTALFEKWKKPNAPLLKFIAVGGLPKPLIRTLSESLLETFQTARLLDPYDVYQHLMSYWSETMQDDVYMIVGDGWVEAATLKLIVVEKDAKAKKEKADIALGKKKFKAELIPTSLIAARYFANEQAAIEKLEGELAAITQQVEELIETHSGEGGFLEELCESNTRLKDSALGDVFEELRWLAIKECCPTEYSAHLASEQEQHQAQESFWTFAGLPTTEDVLKNLPNSKGKQTKTAIKERLKSLKGSDSDEYQILGEYAKREDAMIAANESAKSRAEIMQNAFLHALNTCDSSQAIQDFLDAMKLSGLLRDEKEWSGKIKDARANLDELVVEKYGKLTESEIKTLVVDDKWLARLAADVQSELDRVSQSLTGRVRQLAERYASPLPSLTEQVESLSARVAEHLQKMGAIWN